MSSNDIRSKWTSSLRGQILLRFWICLIIFFVLIGMIQYRTLQVVLYRGVERSLQQEYTLFLDQSRQWLTGRQEVPEKLGDLTPGHLFLLFSAEGELKAQSSRKELSGNSLNKELIVPKILLQKDKTRPTIQTLPNGKKIMTIVRSINGSDKSNKNMGYMVLVAPLAQVDEILKENRRILFLSGLIILIVGSFLTLYILRKPLKPLQKMAEVSKEIAQGRHNLRLPEQNAPTEIEQLRDALNHMLGQLENALKTEQFAKEQMSRFIADASHELRTPLTSIRGFLEILERNRNVDLEILKGVHQTMYKETERLIRMVEDLLTLNRVAQAKLEAIPLAQPASMDTVMPDLLLLLDPLLGSRKLDVKVEQSSIPVESGELKQILYNLVNNAIQHTRETGTIQIETCEKNREIVLSVSDDGEGIPEEDIPYLFERFYRGSRTRRDQNRQGTGLGLAIVADIVRLRGGQIKVQSEIGKGTRFLIFFPKL